MTPPDERAVGSFGPDFERFSADRLDRPLRWWQRLVARRLLEFGADGCLIHPEASFSTARQLGKSILLANLMTWRLDHAEIIGEPQHVLHMASSLRLADLIQRPIRAWAETQDGWAAMRGNGTQEVSARDGTDLWRLYTPNSPYGVSTGLSVIDEAFSIKAAVIEDGVLPTQLERLWPQLLCVSTAHSRTTSLMVDRRLNALSGDGALHIEWSGEPWRELGDVDNWRLASPHWTRQREEMLTRRLRNALQGNQSAQYGETDPLTSFRSQFLNFWPTSAGLDVSGSGERLVPEDVWGSMRQEVETSGPLSFALEDLGGMAVVVAAAGRTASGHITVEAYELTSRDVAYAWIKGHASARADRTGSTLTVGNALRHDSELDDLGVTVTVATYAETKSALSTLRNVVSKRGLVHANSDELARQIEACRVQDQPSGLRVMPGELWDHVRAAAWCVAAVERARRGAPAVY